MHGLQEFGGGYGDGGEKEFGEEGGGPEGVLEGGAGRAGGSVCEPYREMGSGEDQRDLPKGVEEVGEEEGCGRRRCKGEWEGVHYFSSCSRRRESSAIFLASIWRLLMRLMTSSSDEPPNMRSTRSRTA